MLKVRIERVHYFFVQCGNHNQQFYASKNVLDFFNAVIGFIDGGRARYSKSTICLMGIIYYFELFLVTTC